MQSDEIRPT